LNAWQRAVFDLLISSADFFLGLLFDSEDCLDIFLRNVGLSPNVTTQKTVIEDSAEDNNWA
jgi:hypothetical protein